MIKKEDILKAIKKMEEDENKNSKAFTLRVKKVYNSLQETEIPEMVKEVIVYDKLDNTEFWLNPNRDLA